MNASLHDLRLLVLADDPLARAGLAALLGQQAGCQVVGQAAADADLAAEVEAARPDAVIWDLGWSPAAALERLAGQSPASVSGRTRRGLLNLFRLPPILVLLPGGAAASHTALRAWQAGAAGLLRVDGATLTPPTWLEDGDLRVGQLALALGRPGRTVQATLGVVSALGDGTQRIRLPGPVAEQVGQETGLLVNQVVEGSPAEQAGLFLGDTIVAVAGEGVRHHDDLLARLSGDRVGAAVHFRILRGGQVIDVPVVIGERA